METNRLLAPAIVLGIDSPIGLTIVRELGEHGVPVHGIGRSAFSIGAASRHCRTFSTRPVDRRLSEWLPGLITETGAKALFAISESDLVDLAELDPEICGCKILTPRSGPLRIVLDKSLTLATAAALAIDTPETWLPKPDEDFAARAAGLHFPVVVKWQDPTSIASALASRRIPLRKAEFFHTAEDLVRSLRQYDDLGTWPLVQRYCPGVGLGQMIFMDNGAATLRFQHRRLHEWPPEGGVSTLCQAESLELHQPAMKRTEALLKQIGWQGPAMVEYRFDAKTSTYWLMEINGRFWGSIPLAWHCGAHFAWEGYRRAVLGDIAPAAPPRHGLRARYMIPETRRLLRILFHRGEIVDPMFKVRPALTLLHFFLGFLDIRSRYFVFSFRDPMPMLADIRSIVRGLVRREIH